MLARTSPPSLVFARDTRNEKSAWSMATPVLVRSVAPMPATL
ncbi:MAG: hypothetical protein WDN04_21195 [Rhodospirillales bacterium]